jgi:hypothetical protein
MYRTDTSPSSSRSKSKPKKNKRQKQAEIWFLAWLTLRPWRWKWYVPSKRRTLFILHGVTTQKAVFFIVTAAITINKEIIIISSHCFSGSYTTVSSVMMLIWLAVRSCPSSLLSGITNCTLTCNTHPISCALDCITSFVHHPQKRMRCIHHCLCDTSYCFLIIKL